MELYIGGMAQGKSAYVKQKYGDGDVIVFDDFHLRIRSSLEQGKDPVEETEKLLEQIRGLEEEGHLVVIISNEVGNGIVPADPFERDYREATGRALICIAQRADHVERVICGLGQRIK